MLVNIRVEAALIKARNRPLVLAADPQLLNYYGSLLSVFEKPLRACSEGPLSAFIGIFRRDLVLNLDRFGGKSIEVQVTKKYVIKSMENRHQKPFWIYRNIDWIWLV